MGKTSSKKDELEIDDISVMALKGVFKKIFLDDLKKDLDEKTKILCQGMSEIKDDGQSSKNIIRNLAEKYELKPLDLENSINPESTNETVLEEGSDINDVILAYLEYSAKQNKIISDSLALQMENELTKQHVLIEKKIGGITNELSNYQQTHTEWQTKNEQQNQQLKELIIGTSAEEQKNMEIRINNLSKEIANIKERHELQLIEQEKVKEKAKLTVYILLFAVILLLCFQVYQLFFK